jgi:hypothetical protein
MDTVLKHVEELCSDWPVWTLTHTDHATRAVMVTRSDADQTTVTCTITLSYPKGPIILEDVFGHRYRGVNETFADALDNAIAKWSEEDESQGGSETYMREHSSMMEGHGHDASEPSPKLLEQAELMVKEHLHAPQLNGLAHCSYSHGQRRFVARIACPLQSLDTFRANALGLERAHAIIVEIHIGWQYLDSPSVPTVGDICMAPLSSLGASSLANAERRLGSLRWFLKNRLELALAKNHVMLERRRNDFSAEDDAACADLDRFRPSAPEEDFWSGGNKNMFFALTRFLQYRIRSCTSRCLICDSVLGFDGLKLATCDKDLCAHSADSYGLGCDVLYELTRHPEVCELLIMLTLNAAMAGTRGRDVMVPMCPVLINEAAHPSYSGLCHFYHGEFGKGKKNFGLLLNTVLQLPSVSNMVAMAAGDEAKLREGLNAISPLVFPTLRWILSSNRAHLEPIPKKHQIPGLGPFQFHLVSSNATKEGRFRECKASVVNKGSSKNGSFWVWHGSQPGNWHCILRMGLKNYSNTALMSAGAAYGPGIYTARSISTSLGYMGAPQGGWSGSEHFGETAKTQGLVLISLCEVVDEVRNDNTTKAPGNRPTLRDASAEIVTVQDEDLIDTRFLFVFPGGFDGDGKLRGDTVKIPSELLHH